MTLADAGEGKGFIVIAIDDETISMQAMRFGIDAGTVVYVQQNIKGGPVIVCKNQLEIAIGRELAAAIQVSPRG